MKALVSGKNGFIGSHLCKALTGWQLTATYDKADVIFHLAALTRNDRSIEHPIATMDSNVMLSAEIFEQARKFKIPVVYTSSAVIYSPIRTPYQISKIACDELAQWYNDNGGDIRIVRLADVYGPGMTNGPIAAWREQYKKNGAIDVWDGAQSRHYVYIDDAVDALIQAASDTPGVYNVGSTVPHDIKHVAKLLRVPIRIIDPPRAAAPYVRLSPLNYIGKMALEDGMEIIRQKEFM